MKMLILIPVFVISFAHALDKETEEQMNADFYTAVTEGKFKAKVCYESSNLNMTLVKRFNKKSYLVSFSRFLGVYDTQKEIGSTGLLINYGFELIGTTKVKLPDGFDRAVHHFKECKLKIRIE